MNIVVIGGGPAGLYSAILLKKSFPQAQIRVLERNGAEDTFGFGIVLSAETLANLQVADAPSHAQISRQFAYWDDIQVQFRGRLLQSGGHGFSGLQRLALLQILQQRALDLGVEIQYQHGLGADDASLASLGSVDLIIAADGINSAIRERFSDAFQPTVDLRPNRFTWLGARMPLPAFYYSFREDAGGHIWNMHAYQYRPGESTIVIETTEAGFAESGLCVDDEAGTANWVENLFAEDLKGAQVLTNRSFWRQFPTISCKTWCHQWNGVPVVLLGDAAHTAHFSIGSGTKLALEDAIALHAAIVRAHGVDLVAALRDYEADRRDEVSRIQHSANVSLGWFENVARFWSMSPEQFNVSLLTRSKQITYENLRLRDAVLVQTETHRWNQSQARQLGVPTRGDEPWLEAPPMFAPLRLREMTLCNRVVVSPMAQYSAVDGVPNDWHLVHYGSRALGGAGLVFVEMTCPSPQARITPGCTGLWNTEQRDAFARITGFVHANSQAKIGLQLGHAGRKGSTQVGWMKMDHPLPVTAEAGDANWPLLSASSIEYRAGLNQIPRAMTRVDMDEVIAQFVHSAELGAEAGFDMLELHMAHGYLLASFLSPLTNRRTDKYGGELKNRMRFPLELFEAVRAVWPANKPMSVRLSATDWVPGGQTGADTVNVARAFKALGCDLIDVSSGQTDPASKPVYGRMYQAGFAEQVRLEAGIATIAVGAITTADQVNTLLLSGRADLVALARPHLADPYFTLHAAAQAGYEGVAWPVQYETGAVQAYGLAKKRT